MRVCAVLFCRPHSCACVRGLQVRLGLAAVAEGAQLQPGAVLLAHLDDGLLWTRTHSLGVTQTASGECSQRGRVLLLSCDVGCGMWDVGCGSLTPHAQDGDGEMHAGGASERSGCEFTPPPRESPPCSYRLIAPEGSRHEEKSQGYGNGY